MAIHTVTYAADKKLSEHFSLKEFKCPTSKTIKYSDELIALLEKMFSTYKNIGKCIISSGYRTPAYSKKVGGSTTDAHTVGIAVDCCFYDKKNNKIPSKYIQCGAENLGCSGIGRINDYYTHLDVRNSKNYKNAHWFGDEPRKIDNIGSFYSYYGLKQADINSFLGAAQPTPKANAKVKEFQTAANLDQKLNLKVDGIWGAKTEAATKKCSCKKQLIGYTNRNCTKIVQRVVGVTVDGKFGNQTKAAVIKWQAKNGLPQDGVFGAKSWKKYLGV